MLASKGGSHIVDYYYVYNKIVVDIHKRSSLLRRIRITDVKSFILKLNFGTKWFQNDIRSKRESFVKFKLSKLFLLIILKDLLPVSASRWHLKSTICVITFTLVVYTQGNP